MLTLDYGLFIILKCFGGAAMIGGIAPDCKSGTLKRSWFESNHPHQVLMISCIAYKVQLIHADIAQ